MSAVALSSCGSAHPGAAAQVGDVSISDQALEQSVQGFCHLIDTINRTQQGTNPPVPTRTALLSALNTLVMGEAIDQLAEQKNVDVSSAEVGQWVSTLPLNFAQVPENGAEDLREVIRRVGRNTLLTQKLGQAAYQQQNPGAPAPSAQQVQQLGQEQVNSYIRRAGVETDPRYGQVLDTRQLPGTGSLSVPVSQEGVASQSVPDASNTLPQNQECG